MLKKILFLSVVLFSIVSLRAQTITTYAGHGVSAYGGDGGPATAAGFMPHDLKMDAAGNIYIADRPNGRIRKIDTSGVISTVTPSALSPNSFALDNVGNIYIATGTILKVNTLGIVSTFLTGVSNPYGITYDTLRNVLLVADSYHNLVKRVDTFGTVTVIAGNGTAGFSGDNGAATSAQLSWPSHAVADKWGNIYICDGSNNRIRKVDTSGIITTIAGTGPTTTSPGAYVGSYAGDGGPATAAHFNLPFRITFDTTGNMFVCDNGNNCIRRIDTAGVVSLIAGNTTLGFSGDGGPATAAEMGQPNGTVFDKAGNLYIADWDNSRIRKVSLGSSTTGLAAHEAGVAAIRIFPNPNNGVFSINVTGSYREKAIVTITSVDGKVIKEMHIQTNSIADINFETPIPQGVYLVTVVSDHGKVTQLMAIR